MDPELPEEEEAEEWPEWQDLMNNPGPGVTVNNKVGVEIPEDMQDKVRLTFEAVL